MTFPNNKLKNPYYFIKDNIVYEISDKQDADNCGQHYVTYNVTSLDGDDKVFVKKGDKYLDVHGNPTIAKSDNYYQVSTGNLDIEANKVVFPWICVEYKEKATDTETKKAYFWLDYLIDDGDTFDGTMFIMNSRHAPEDGSYIEYYKEVVLAQIGLFYANGYSDTEIKRNFPEYMFAEKYSENIPENATANVTINGKKVYLVNVTTSAEDVEITISEEDMINAFYTYCNEQVVAYANRLLKRVDKKLAGTTDEQIPVIVSEDTVVDLEEDTEEDGEGGDSGGDDVVTAPSITTKRDNNIYVRNAALDVDCATTSLNINCGGGVYYAWSPGDVNDPYSCLFTTTQAPKVNIDFTYAIMEVSSGSRTYEMAETGYVVETYNNGENTTNYYVITLPNRIQGGTLKITGCDDYNHVLDGTHITVIAAPAKDYSLGTLTVNGGEVENPYEFDIHRNVTIGVTFVGLEQEHGGIAHDPEIIGNDEPIDNLDPSDPFNNTENYGEDNGENNGDTIEQNEMV